MGGCFREKCCLVYTVEFSIYVEDVGSDILIAVGQYVCLCVILHFRFLYLKLFSHQHAAFLGLFTSELFYFFYCTVWSTVLCVLLFYLSTYTFIGVLLHFCSTNIFDVNRKQNSTKNFLSELETSIFAETLFFCHATIQSLRCYCINFLRNKNFFFK